MERVRKVLKAMEGRGVMGPAPLFSFLDVLNVLEVISREGAIGRQRLSMEVGLGEGSMRTILKRLKKLGLVESNKLGCALTEDGARFLQVLKSKLGSPIPLQRSFLAIGESNFGILVKGAGDKVGSGIEQRDAAVRMGAAGATTLIFKGGKLLMPPTNKSLDEDWPELAENIRQTFAPKENDVIIVCGAENKVAAERGARAAAWSLIEVNN